MAQVHYKLQQILQLFLLHVLKVSSGNWHKFRVGTAIKKPLWYKLFKKKKGECYTSTVGILLFYYPVKKLGII